MLLERTMNRIALTCCLVILLSTAHASPEQYLLLLTEKQCVELSLDMIRKGVQQGDVNQVMEVMGESVSIRNVKSKTHTEIARDLGRLFAISSNRETAAATKATGTGTSIDAEPRYTDFEILSPQIIVRGDSAFVNCELVLWNTVSNGSAQNGSSAAEQIVFSSPGTDHPEQTSSRDPLRWRLVKCNKLFDFLGNDGAQAAGETTNNGGQR